MKEGHTKKIPIQKMDPQVAKQIKSMAQMPLPWEALTGSSREVDSIKPKGKTR